MALRVLHIYHKMDLPEVHVVEMLLAHGVDLEVMCHPENPYNERLAAQGFFTEPLISRHRLDPRAIFRIRKKLKSKKYDVLHVFTSRNLSTSILASRGLRPRPRIVAYRGAMGNVSKFDPTSQLTFRNNKVDKIICVSQAIAKYLVSTGIPPEKIETIYKGHEIDWYHSSERTALDEFNIPRDAFVLCCVANMRPSKGVDVLLEAANLLKDDDRFHYLLLGDIRDPRLHEMARSLSVRDRLHFTGWRKDAAALVGACDAMVLPTKGSEGLPKAVIEAMAQGIPAIGTTVGGTPELINDGETGYLVEPNSPEQIAEAIRRIASDPERLKEFGIASRKRIQESFSLNRTVQETEDLYSRVCAEAALSEAASVA